MKTNVSRQLATALRAMLEEFAGYRDDNVTEDGERPEEWREPRAMQRARKALEAYEAERKRLARRARTWREIARKGLK